MSLVIVILPQLIAIPSTPVAEAAEKSLIKKEKKKVSVAVT